MSLPSEFAVLDTSSASGRGEQRFTAGIHVPSSGMLKPVAGHLILKQVREHA